MEAIVSQIAIALAAVIGAYVAFVKAGPERNKMSAEIALAGAQAQAQIINDLQEEVDRLKRENQEIKQQHAEEKAQMRAELDEMRELNMTLQRRMLALENRLKESSAL